MSEDPGSLRPVEALRLLGRIRKILGITAIADYLGKIAHKLNRLEKLVMASTQEVLDALKAVGTDIDTDFATISTQLAALQTRADNGGAIEAADMGTVLSAVQGLRGNIASKFATLTNPAPAPAPSQAPAPSPAPAPSSFSSTVSSESVTPSSVA